MRLLRRVLFWVFVVLYLTVCPLMVFYAFGYWFTSGATGGLVKTGLIYLSTAPPGASVYVGNRRYTQPTPTILRDLVPGEYPIRLVLKDHQPWTQTVPVEAEKATVLEHVLLLPRAFGRDMLVPEASEQLMPVAGTHLLLLASGPTLEDLSVYDAKHQTHWPLLPPESPFQRAKLVSHAMVTGSSSVFLRVATPDGERFLWVELKPEANRIEDLTHLFPEVPRLVVWDVSDRRWFFALHADSLNRVDLTSKALYPKWVEHVLGVGVFDRTVSVVSSDGQIARMDLDGRPTGLTPDEDRLPATLTGSLESLQLHPVTKKRFLMLSENGALLTNCEPYRLVENGVVGLEVDAKRERALVWQKHALGVVELLRTRKGEGTDEGVTLRWVFTSYHGEAPPSQTGPVPTSWNGAGRSGGPVPEGSSPKPPLLGFAKQSRGGTGFTHGGKIEQAFWVFEGSHILFRDGDRVWLVELETYGTPHLAELLRVKRGSDVAYDESTGRLLYLDRDTGFLTSLDVVPQQEIVLLPFPERREERMPIHVQAP